MATDSRHAAPQSQLPEERQGRTVGRFCQVCGSIYPLHRGSTGARRCTAATTSPRRAPTRGTPSRRAPTGGSPPSRCCRRRSRRPPPTSAGLAREGERDLRRGAGRAAGRRLAGPDRHPPRGPGLPDLPHGRAAAGRGPARGLPRLMLVGRPRPPRGGGAAPLRLHGGPRMFAWFNRSASPRRSSGGGSGSAP